MKKLLLAESENQDHKNADAFVLIIMSHGNDNTVQGTDWNELSLKEVKDYFNAKGCPSLINKPKAFIVQACQGSKHFLLFIIVFGESARRRHSLFLLSLKNPCSD